MDTSHGDYVSSSVPSTSGQRVSKPLSCWSPRCNTFWIRCCASGHVSAVSKEVMASRSRSADGNETWLTRFFAAAIARRSKEAIRRASPSAKPSSSAEVDWIKAEDNNIRIHSGSSSYLDRETLSELCARLDPKKFVRVHRSALINVDRIKEIMIINGEYELVLQSVVQI